MEKVKIKGHDITFIPAKDNFNRRALQYKNKLISSLGELGVKRDQVDLELDGYCGRDSKASVTWFFEGHRMYYEVATQTRYIITLSLQLIEKRDDLSYFTINQWKNLLANLLKMKMFTMNEKLLENSLT